MKHILCLPLILSVAACADSGARYQPILDGPATRAYQADLTACQTLARDQKQFDQETLGAALLGAGAGAALGEIDSDDALMDPDALARQIIELRANGVHSPQPGAVSITSVTERGTLYSLDHIAEIARTAHENDLSVHLDGARFANAVAALGCSPAEMSWKAGIDALSFGGTKNGLMGAEACVVFDPAKARDLELRRHRGGHNFSKNRFLAAQFDAYLENDLWLTLAHSSNGAAQDLAAGLGQIPGVSFLHDTPANMMFPRFPRAAHQRLKAAGAQYNLWDGPLDGDPDQDVAARLVCDWSCPADSITRFCALVRG